MLVALTVRRVKPGRLEDFKKAWELEKAPPGWTRAYTVKNVEDDNEVVSFGFFEGSLEDLRQSQKDYDYAAQRSEVDEFVESTGTDGIFEVISEMAE